MQVEPPDAILEFLAALPDTIRDAACANLLMLVDPVNLNAETPTVEAVTYYLMGQSGSLDVASKVITTTLMLDYVFAFNPYREDYLTGVADESGDAFIRKLALQGPMKSRHWDSAAGAWAQQRLGGLSNEALRQFQKRLLNR